MENTKKISLEEFMAEKKPDIHGLNRFRDDIVILYNSGYSLKQIHEYVSLNGYAASYSPFTRWVKRHINFESETVDSVKTEMRESTSTSKLNPKSKAASSTFSQQKASLETKEKDDEDEEMPLEEQLRLARKYLEESKKSDAERNSWMDYKPPSAR